MKDEFKPVRFDEYDYWYVEWLHSGEWIAQTFLIQKGTPPEQYCDERLKAEWKHGTTGAVTKRERYRLVKLLAKE